MKFTLKNKLIGLFLLTGLVPFLIIGLYSFQRANTYMKKQVFSHLASTRNAKKVQLTKLFNDIARDISTLAKSEDVQGFVNNLVKYHNDIEAEEKGPFLVKTDAYSKLLAQENTDFLEYYIRGYGYHDLFIICRPHGHVMYSLRNGKDLGTNLGFGPYRDSPLAAVWQKVVETRSAAVEDFRKYAPSNDEPGCFLGVPIIKNDGEFIGVMALQLQIETINKIIQERTGFGKTGESYLVGKDFLMRSDSVLDPKNRSVTASFSNPDTGKTETEPVRRALAGETGEALTIDYRGQSVLSAYTPVDFFQIRWALIAEVDEKDAFQTRYQLRDALWFIGIIIMVAVILIGFFFSRTLSLPLKEGAQNLNSTSAEILAAIQQQSSSIKEQAVAVQETSSTMEEIRETGSQVAERAKEVARVAEATSSASEVGIRAVEDTHEIMESIRAQVEQVAQNIVSLSEKTQAIGDIIATVNDIAEQSNLLALNAAIEAVGAGQHGERFSVVANEMKSLADQAKTSTVEVRTILSEIQGGIGTSVMSTEEAVKRVETGRSKSEVAANTIKQLTDTTTESITAFQQIVAGTGQQQIGLDQVTQALKDIEQGTEQTASGIGQIETAVANLNELSSRLKTIVESD